MAFDEQEQVNDVDKFLMAFDEQKQVNDVDKFLILINEQEQVKEVDEFSMAFDEQEQVNNVDASDGAISATDDVSGVLVLVSYQMDYPQIFYNCYQRKLNHVKRQGRNISMRGKSFKKN